MLEELQQKCQFVHKFTIDNQTSVEFNPSSFSIKDLKTGAILSRHDNTCNLYPFTTLVRSSTLLATSQDWWHTRLGHSGVQVVDVLHFNFSIYCNKTMNSSLCNAFLLSKHTGLPFFDSPSVTFAPFDIIHCDLWASPVLRKTCYKYDMVLIDNFTYYIWVYPLKYKSDTFLNFKKFYKLIWTQFNWKIRSFQCDLGVEFDNNEFKTFAQTHDIVSFFSFPQPS